MRQRQKKLKITPCQQIVASLSFFQFMANLINPIYGQISKALSVRLTFPLKVPFILQKLKIDFKNL